MTVGDMTPMGATPDEVEDYPEWYVVMRAAKWLGVPPWELAEKPVWWMQWAVLAMGAENRAEKTLNERAAKRSKRR